MSGGRQAARGPQKAPAHPPKPLQQPGGGEEQRGAAEQAGGHTAPRPGESAGHVVRVVPGLFPEAWRRGLMQPLRVWYLLRTLDQDACGRVDKRKTLGILERLGWSQASAYRLISEGMGTFWRQETTLIGEKRIGIVFPNGGTEAATTKPKAYLIQ